MTTAGGWPRRAWRVVESALNGTELFALVGVALFAVAFATLLVLGIDVT